MNTKTCRKCFREQPSADFHPGRRVCKDCIRLYHRSRYQANPGEGRERAKAWRLANQDRYRVNQERWKSEHKTELQAYFSHYFRENRERKVELHRAWVKAHPEREAERQRRRKAWKLGSEVVLVDYGEIAKRDDMWCYLCWQDIPQEQLAFDHVVALARGGPHTPENIRATHRRCNAAKHARPLAEVI